MATNRYSEISTSQFNPMSFQEISAPALMRRQQHDKILADQASILQGLAQVKPHEKFYTEAQRLKKDIESKIDNFSTQLSTEGFSNQTNANMIALNREYRNLISPTGKLGMINEHNEALQKTYADSIANSIKMGNSEVVAKMRANEALKKHLQEPMYNKNGQVIPFSSSSAPKYVDPIKFTDELASRAKMSSSEWKKAVSGLKMDNAGNRFVVDQSKAGAKGSNLQQLQAAADTINAVLNDPSSELRQSADYNYKNLNSLRDQIAKQLNIYRQEETKTASDFGYSNVDWYDAPKGKSGKDEGSPATGVTQNTVTVGSEPNSYSDIERIGTNRVPVATQSGSPLTMGTTGNSIVKAGKFTHQDISNPLIKKQYIDIWNNNRTKGIFPAGSHADDPEVAKIITKMIKDNGPVTLSTKVLVPDVDRNEYMFAGKQATKDRNERSNVIGSNLATGRQRMQDPENPDKVLTPKEFNDRGYKIYYDSYYSPNNFVKNPFGNSDQGAVPHQVIVSKNGQRVGTALVSRTEEDLRSPEGRASQVLHNVFQTTTLSPNMEHSFNNPRLKANGIKDLKVKYITRENGQQLSQPIMEIKVNGRAPIQMTEDDFTKEIYDIFTTK